MNSDGFSFMSGHGVVAAATIALERGIIVPGGDGASLTFDTPAGAVRVKVSWQHGKVEWVRFLNVPSFVMHGGIDVALATRRVRADVIWRRLHAIVDGESAGVPLDAPTS